MSIKHIDESTPLPLNFNESDTVRVLRGEEIVGEWVAPTTGSMFSIVVTNGPDTYSGPLDSMAVVVDMRPMKDGAFYHVEGYDRDGNEIVKRLARAKD